MPQQLYYVTIILFFQLPAASAECAIIKYNNKDSVRNDNSKSGERIFLLLSISAQIS